MTIRWPTQRTNRAVFLDRDGVVNQARVIDDKPYPPSNLMELKILPGVADSLIAFREAGWLSIVVTNQPDVARGTMSIADVESINKYLEDHLEISCILTCYHDDADQCGCRKPLPGAFFAAAHQYKINLAGSYMIGDRWRDIEAGVNAGCKTVFIDYGYDEKRPTNYDFSVASLAEATSIILGDSHERT